MHGFSGGKPAEEELLAPSAAATDETPLTHSLAAQEFFDFWVGLAPQPPI